MKKIFIIVLVFSALFLISGITFADTTQNTPATKSNLPRVSAPAANRPDQIPIKYTAEEQSCIKAAQKTRADATKFAVDALNSATKDALKIKQDAMAAVRSEKDVKVKSAALKVANETYNNNENVKRAKVPYNSAVKTANDKYKIDLEACLSRQNNNDKGNNKNIGDSGFLKGIVNSASAAISNTFYNVFSRIFIGIKGFFSGKK